MKNPWFKFYPSDWASDQGLKSCSLEARGLWLEMLCIMHNATPRGHLLIGNFAVTPEKLGSLSGVHMRTLKRCLAELRDANVYSEENGIIVSRKMVRDENKAQRDRENGKGGGNPKLKEGVNPEDKAQKPDTRSQIPEKKRENGNSHSPRMKGNRISDDWKPDVEYAKSKGLRSDEIQREAEKFKNYWSAKPGSQGVKLDWNATWRNWVLSTVDRLGRQPELSIHIPLNSSPADWSAILSIYKATGRWNRSNGSEPGQAGCVVPIEILRAAGL